MPIALDPEMLALAYDYLCSQAPFNKWNLPPSDEVKFLVIRKRDRYAHFQIKDGIPHIAVSSRMVGRHETLISTMAHEILHFHMHLAGFKEAGDHGAAFQKLANRVCKIHEFDRLTF